MKILSLLILTLALFVNLSAQTAEFSKTTGSGVGELGYFAKLNFEIGSNQFEIRDNGHGKRVKGDSMTNFRLQLDKGESLVNVYFASYKNDLIFLYGADAGGEGIGYIASFNAVTLKQKWRAIISGFNVGQGLIEKNFAYVTAIGFVGKLNLLTGKYVWKHDDLYGWNRNNGAFNSFELPELEGNNIIFTEKTVYNKTNILAVNKITGKIVRTVLGK